MNRRKMMKSWVAVGLAALLPRAAGAAGHGKKDSLNIVPLPNPGKGRIPVAFLLSAGAEVVDFAGPWGVFEYAIPPDAAEPPFQLYTVAESTAPLKVSGGMTIVPDYALDNAPPPKVIVVPAMGDPSAALLNWLRNASKGTDLTL